MASTTVLVSVEHARKEYGRQGKSVTAVDDVSFTLQTGESLAIVGESGSGKSTVARMVMGMTDPTSGTVQLDGGATPAQGTRTGARLARAGFIQMVFQDPYSSLDPRQRIGECLAEAVAMHGSTTKSERAHRVAQLLEQVSLDASLARSFPRALSGGQRQRVAIARALAPRPRVLVLDEAVSALDVSVQAKILELLARIRREQDVSFIFISHDLGVVRQVTDRILVMRDGLVVESGATASVLDDPQHPYTKLLLRCVPGLGWRAPDALAAVENFRQIS